MFPSLQQQGQNFTPQKCILCLRNPLVTFQMQNMLFLLFSCMRFFNLKTSRITLTILVMGKVVQLQYLHQEIILHKLWHTLEIMKSEKSAINIFHTL